jgi:hypothetical protein
MKRRHLAALLVVLALIASGCAERSDTDEGADSDGTDDSTPTSASGETFGTLESPCGPADPDSAEPTSSDPAETQGVADGAISLGTVADPGFAGQPGLNQDVFDAGNAFVEWCNDQGGINGRQIELTEYDAAISQYAQRMTEACTQEFAMVGGGAVSDNLWATTGQQCGLIDVAGFAVTPEKVGVSGPAEVEETRTIQPLPSPSNELMVGAYQFLADEFPDVQTNAGIVYGDLQTIITQKDRQVQGMEEVGYDFVQESAYNILGEANWAPFANSIRDDDVQYLTYLGDAGNMANLQLALTELGYDPEVTQGEANLYDPEYLAAAGDAAEGTYVKTAVWPYEEADENPATQQYMDLVDAQGGRVALLGTQSFSAWLLFATLADECDVAGTLTRSCILEKGSELHEWDGGGLHAPADPGNNSGTECFILLQVQDGAFIRSEPSAADGGDHGYNCAEENLLELEGSFSTS